MEVCQAFLSHCAICCIEPCNMYRVARPKKQGQVRPTSDIQTSQDMAQLCHTFVQACNLQACNLPKALRGQLAGAMRRS